MFYPICYNTNVNFDAGIFQAWIQNKFAEWRGARRESLANYATYLGISPQVMSNWWNGTLKERPNPRSYNILIEKYGFEVYDALGLERPSDSQFFEGLPSEIAGPLKAAIEEIRATGMNKETDVATPEDIELIKAIFEKHGVDIKIVTR